MKQESQQNNQYLLNKEGLSLVKYECSKKEKGLDQNDGLY
jgi:hypothetical protein